MASLEPVEPLLLREFENVPASATVMAVGFDAVLGWEHVSAPELPAGVDITPAGETWTISWQLVPDLFPIDGVTYLQDGQLHEASAWVDVPESAEQIISFRALRTNKRTYALTVTANGLVIGPTGPVPASATMTYEVIILQQYNTNRDILQEMINARR